MNIAYRIFHTLSILRKRSNQFLYIIGMVVVLLAPKALLAQISDEVKANIDSLFTDWNNPNAPGIAAVVISEGEVVYQKEFGLADLENRRPITRNTKFQLGGMSRHFTAFAILLLEQRGLLSLDEPVRKYLKDFPVFDSPLTLRHLLYHTNGLYEYETLKTIMGWSPNDIFTQADMISLVREQSKPNFEPGTAFSYTSTGCALLAEVIASVSEKSFSQFCKDEIFDPLGMENTEFVEEPTALINNLAEAYQTQDGVNYRKQARNIGVTGAVNLYSTTADLAKWLLHYETPKDEYAKIVRKMDAPARSSSGAVHNPSRGLLTIGQQFQHAERGLDKIYQTGYLNGYASAVFRFPSKNYTGLVLSNRGDYYNGYIPMQIAEFFVSDAYTEPPTTDFSTFPTNKLSPEALKKHEGHYWDPEGTYARRISLRADTLRYQRATSESALLPITENTYRMMVPGDDKLVISFKKSQGNSSMYVSISGSDPFIYHKYTPANTPRESLAEYTGTYLNLNYDGVYKVKLEDNGLVADNFRGDRTQFSEITKDVFDGDTYHMGAIEFRRDDSEEILGFYVQSNSLKNLWFEKVK